MARSTNNSVEKNHMPKVLRTLAITVYVLVFFASATFFLFAHGFPPFARIMTVSELSSSMDLLAGVRVRVKGEIVGVMYIPEQVPPYRFGLRDPGTRVCVGLTWPNGDFSKVPFARIVTVVGVVAGGQTSGLWKPRTLLFLKAETIEA
jgi:hypothetical protein